MSPWVSLFPLELRTRLRSSLTVEDVIVLAPVFLYPRRVLLQLHHRPKASGQPHSIPRCGSTPLQEGVAGKQLSFLQEKMAKDLRGDSLTSQWLKSMSSRQKVFAWLCATG